MGESITEVEIGDWLKSEGDAIKKDEEIVALESEKATVQLPAPVAGVLGKILKRKGEKAAIGEVVAVIESGGKAGEKGEAAAKTQEKAEPPKKQQPAQAEARSAAQVASAPAGASAGTATKGRAASSAGRSLEEGTSVLEKKPTEPSAEAASRATSEAVTPASSPAQRISTPAISTGAEAPPPVPARAERPQGPRGAAGVSDNGASGRQEEVVPMTLLRRTVAQRLVEAQRTMAMLTTFNEIDMSAVMALRKEHQEGFVQKHGIKLGFMSFFVKAAIEALKAIPQINASVRGNDIVYHNYFDIGIAIGGGKGLVVPVLRNAERLSFAAVEKAVADFAGRAKESKLTPDELQSGTFTITNGGVYGSLLSTPIINPPQSGILGMHTIQQRPIAVDGNVVIRPMMYVALSYDHRIVDGREAVTFLVRIKEMIENPARILLEI
jgi:2-oxoglutarate dehydrogenase E2 component (dihydrolipoamide succinyltransferase)